MAKNFLLLYSLLWLTLYGCPAYGHPTVSIREQLIAIFAAEVGTPEVGKNNHGPGPKRYLAACGLPEGYPYCACFAKYSFAKLGIPTPGATAWSPSWFPPARVIWKQGRGRTPQPADVFGLYYAKLGRIGHVGFIERWEDPRGDDWTYTVEGNTNGEGSRDGDGVHRRRRLKRQIHIVANWIDS